MPSPKFCAQSYKLTPQSHAAILCHSRIISLSPHCTRIRCRNCALLDRPLACWTSLRGKFSGSNSRDTANNIRRTTYTRFLHAIRFAGVGNPGAGLSYQTSRRDRFLSLRPQSDVRGSSLGHLRPSSLVPQCRRPGVWHRHISGIPFVHLVVRGTDAAADFRSRV